MIDSLRGLLRDERVQTALVCLGILLVIGVALMPVSIWTDAPENAEPPFNNVEFPQNGSFTASYEYTHTTHSGYILTALTPAKGFVAKIPGQSATVTETLTYDAEQDIAHAVWSNEAKGVSAELYAVNNTMFWRVTATDSARINNFANAYESKENVTVVRGSSNNSVTVVFNKVMPTWKPRPGGFAFRPSWSNRFRVTTTDGNHELVPYQAVSETSGQMTTDDKGRVTELTATESGRVLVAKDDKGNAVTVWRTGNGKKITFLSSLINPTRSASVEYTMKRSASLTETPSWVEEARQVHYGDD